MTTDEIKALMRGLNVMPLAPTPAGMSAYSLPAIEEAGADVNEVREWAEANGGGEESATTQSRGLRPGRLVAAAPNIVRYLVVPVRALQNNS